MAELYLVRHAQASFHDAEYDRLSALGEQQSLWLGEYFAARGIAFDVHVSGTLRRHRQTLEGIARGMGASSGVVHECLAGLDEYDFRALVLAFAGAHPDHREVVAWQAASADKPAFYRVLKLAMLEWADETLAGPLPETWRAFRGRIESAATELQALSAHHKRMLVISSGGAMAALLGGRLELQVAHIVDLNMQIRNTSISHFWVNGQRFLLSSWNAVPHLEDTGRGNAITYG